MPPVCSPAEELSVRTWDFRAAEDHENRVQQLRTARQTRKTRSRRRAEGPDPRQQASGSTVSAASLSRSLPANFGAASFGGRRDPSEDTDDEAGPSDAGRGPTPPGPRSGGPSDGGAGEQGDLDSRGWGSGMHRESERGSGGREWGGRAGPSGGPGSTSASAAVLPSPRVLRGAAQPDSARLTEMQSWKIVRPRPVVGSSEEVSSPVGRCKTVKVAG
jgi:hypothetical protein